ncbi:hypothetical protein [Flavobacterium cyclinae]|uniref:hypothetical protein n=1 Tax=Flavobacterium cyclinae TaxID=2895947 RepID=UPI001E3F2542|nr:hypothetical protein [Flavobacterium cyclinae]UGS21925.1 hypothetical protein LOS86_04695 [Flavobacterium cyclinae]
MTLKKYNKTNFHKHTFCEFTEVDATLIPNIDRHFKSKSGSGYCFTDKGVYRISNHWGRAANCRWRLISKTNSDSSSKVNNGQSRIGYANWTNFYPNNEIENLFYIEVNFEINNVTFQHKFNPNYDGKAVLRNASETAKVIRQIKEILESDTWAKYLDFDDLEQLRKEIILQLITTNKSLQILKKELLK